MIGMEWWEPVSFIGSMENILQKWGPMLVAVKHTKRQETATYTPTDRSMKNTHVKVMAWVSSERPAKSSSLQLFARHWVCSPLCVLTQWTAKEMSKEVRDAQDRIKKFQECKLLNHGQPSAFFFLNHKLEIIRTRNNISWRTAAGFQ